MNSFERYLGDTYELVDTLKNSEQGFVAAVYDKRARRLCTMKQRDLKSLPIYQTLKDLNNPHVPTIYRLFERDEKLIVVEEYIDGQTLEEILLYQSTALDEASAEKILLQLCDALAAFHAKNIIHRDLKPSNIMLTEKFFVKVIDFGIARIFKPESSADTETLGTKGYAPPEQYGLFDFGQTDPRSDIYALGVTVKELLGRDYDGRLKKILDRCTEPAPAQRYQSADELRHAVTSSKIFGRVKNFLVVAAAGLVVFFLPQTLDLGEAPQPVEEMPASEEIITPETQSPVEEKSSAKTFDDSAIKLPETVIKNNDVSIPNSSFQIPNSISPPAPLPEINSPTPPAEPQKETSGKVELSLYLNGELTGKEHMVYLDGWQSWRRDKYGQILFPDSWQAQLHIENHGGKDLLNPQLEVNIGQDKKTFDLPAIRNGASFDFDIPLGNKMASPENGSGHLIITLHEEGSPPIMLGKTFFLVK